MSLLSLISFGAAMFVLAASPGPGVFATVARALAGGFPRAAILAAGIITGDLIFLLLAAFGLSAMADILGSFFIFVKYAGGFYLLWLGIKIWRSEPGAAPATPEDKQKSGKDFLSGLLITLANPKVIFFYLGFLPTFVDLSRLSSKDITALCFVTAAVLAAVLLSYAFAAVKTGKLFSSRRTRRNMNRCAAGAMMSAGILILIKE